MRDHGFKQKFVGLTFLFYNLANRIFWKYNEINVNWHERSEMIQGHIPPNHSVLEFGAGKGRLKDISQNSNYLATDLILRPGIDLIIDLNKPFQLEHKYDTSVLAGVLEYLDSPFNSLKRVAEHTSYNIILTYCFPSDGFKKYNRRKLMWVNDLTESNLISIFKELGFKILSSELIEKKRDYRQHIWVLVRKDPLK